MQGLFTIEEVRQMHDLSTRSYNCCTRNDISNLRELTTYYLHNDNFYALPGAGELVNTELTDTCRFYLTDSEDIISELIEAMYSEGVITPKERSLTLNLGLKSLAQLIEFIEQEEVESIKLKKWKTKIKSINQTHKISKDTITDTEESNEVKLFQSVLQLRKNELSVRSQNNIDVLVKLKPNYGAASTLNIDYLMSLRGIGKESAQEILNLSSQITSQLATILNNFSTNEIDVILQLEKDLEVPFNTLFQFFLKKKLGIENQLPFFEIFDVVSSCKLDNRSLTIFNLLYSSDNYLQSNKEIILQLSEEFNLSKERIRQLKEKSLLTIEALLILQAELFIKHDLKTNEYIPYYSEAVFELKEVRKHEKVSVPDFLVFKALSVLYPNYKPLLILGKFKKYKYLTKEWVLESIDFQKFAQSIEQVYSSERDHEIELNLLGLIYSNKKLLKISIDEIRILSKIVEDYLYKEYNLITDSEGNIAFPRTSKKLTYEYIIEVLRREERPMHIDEIAYSLNNSPFYKKQNATGSSVRSHLLNYKDIFVNTAHSTYGLKEWEDSGFIKGGTILDIIEEYLENSLHPKHTHDIFAYVIQYRETDERSIIGLLDSDTKNRFIKYKSSFWGKVGKHSLDFNQDLSRLPGKWFSSFKNNYFLNKQTVLTIDEIIQIESKKHSTHKSHIRAYINRYIYLGKLTLVNNQLILQDED